MGTLIDSSVLIAGERGQLDLETVLAEYAEEEFAISAKRVPVRPHDLLIAATAMARGHKLASRDERSFPKIAGLSLVRW